MGCLAFIIAFFLLCAGYPGWAAAVVIAALIFGDDDK
jgi:hypothetical protein